MRSRGKYRERKRGGVREAVFIGGGEVRAGCFERPVRARRERESRDGSRVVRFEFQSRVALSIGDDGQNAGKKYTNNAFLTYPCEVDLYYLGGGNQGMHRFKRCVITNLQINYTPEGGPAFVGGVGAPAFYELTLGFQETQIWTARDFALEVSGSAENEETTEAKPIRSGFSGSR